MRLFVLLTSMSILSACSAPGPRLTEYTQADRSCVEGDWANVAKYFLEDEANALVSRIDGLATSGKPPFCVEPGLHYLTVAASAPGWVSGQTYVQLSMEPGKTYRIRATLENPTTFVYRVLEIVGEEERELQQLRSYASTRH